MKKKSTSAAVKMLVMILLLTLTQFVFAGTEKSATVNSSLKPAQVILSFTFMVALIIVPLFKRKVKTDK